MVSRKDKNQKHFLCPLPLQCSAVTDTTPLSRQCGGTAPTFALVNATSTSNLFGSSWNSMTEERASIIWKVILLFMRSTPALSLEPLEGPQDPHCKQQSVQQHGIKNVGQCHPSGLSQHQNTNIVALTPAILKQHPSEWGRWLKNSESAWAIRRYYLRTKQHSLVLLKCQSWFFFSKPWQIL